MSSDEKICPHCAETVKAAAVKCKHCGSALPPQPQPPSEVIRPEKRKASTREMLGCLGIFMAIGLISAIFKGGDAPEASNSMVAADDDVGELAQNRQRPLASERKAVETPPSEKSIRQPDLHTTAVELAAAYHANEVAAQARFGRKLLEVEGQVKAVELDLFNNPVVQLATTVPGIETEAHFRKSQAPAASQLQAGYTVTFWCDQLTEVLGNPVLEKCSFSLPDFTK